MGKKVEMGRTLWREGMKREGRGRRKNTVTESKGEKTVNMLCLQSRGEEMRGIKVKMYSDTELN